MEKDKVVESGIVERSKRVFCLWCLFVVKTEEQLTESVVGRTKVAGSE